MAINVDQNRIQIILKEYEALKSEIKYFFNMQFTLIGFWLVFISALVGYIFSSIEIGDKTAPFFIYLILMVLIPGVCDVLGLIWLDFTTRVVKAAHYIFMIENRLKGTFDEEEYVLGWEHYVFTDSQRGKILERVHNYFYYCFMLGIFFLAPPVLCLFTAHYTGWIYSMDKVFILLLVVIEMVTVLFSFLYIRRILSYSDEKKKILEIESDSMFKEKIENVFFGFIGLLIIAIAIGVAYIISSWILGYVFDFLATYGIVLYFWIECILYIILTILILYVMDCIFERIFNE